MHNRSLLIGALLVVLGVAWSPPPTLACSCAPPPDPLKALEGSFAVFEGVMVERTESPPAQVEGEDGAISVRAGSARATFRFTVTRRFKGELGATVEISSAVSGASCGRNFDVGSSYLVYAFDGGEGALADGLCTRTRETARAEEDFTALGEGMAPTTALPTAEGAPPASAPPANDDDSAKREAKVKVTPTPAPAVRPAPVPTKGNAPAEDNGEDDLRSGPFNCSTAASGGGAGAGALLALLFGALRLRRRPWRSAKLARSRAPRPPFAR